MEEPEQAEGAEAVEEAAELLVQGALAEPLEAVGLAEAAPELELAREAERAQPEAESQVL